MTAAAPKVVTHAQYATALTGMYGSTTLEVAEPDSTLVFPFTGLRDGELVVAFLTLGPASGIPGKLDASGELTEDGRAQLVTAAHTQIAVANGRPILWACARERDAELLQALLDGPLADLRSGDGVSGIEVAFLPPSLLRAQWLERGRWRPPIGDLPEEGAEPPQADV